MPGPAPCRRVLDIAPVIVYRSTLLRIASPDRVPSEFCQDGFWCPYQLAGGDQEAVCRVWEPPVRDCAGQPAEGMLACGRKCGRASVGNTAGRRDIVGGVAMTRATPWQCPAWASWAGCGAETGIYPAMPVSIPATTTSEHGSSAHSDIRAVDSNTLMDRTDYSLLYFMHQTKQIVTYEYYLSSTILNITHSISDWFLNYSIM